MPSPGQIASNEPFHGAYVPIKHYGRDARVQAVMLEIRRDMYMREASIQAEVTALKQVTQAVAALVFLRTK